MKKLPPGKDVKRWFAISNQRHRQSGIAGFLQLTIFSFSAIHHTATIDINGLAGDAALGQQIGH
jgi:hypothetical protein